MTNKIVMDRFITVCKEEPDEAYDFFLRTWEGMTKEDMKNIVQELMYAVWEKARFDERRVLKCLGKELEDKYRDEEE